MENTPNNSPSRFRRSENPRSTNCITVDMLSSASLYSYCICGNDSIKGTVISLSLAFVSLYIKKMVHHSFFPIPLENKPIIARCLTGCELHFSSLWNQLVRKVIHLIFIFCCELSLFLKICDYNFALHLNAQKCKHLS